MCGIIGVASTEGMRNRGERLHFMKMGLDIDSWRGWESTGLALVPQGSRDAPIVYKRALNGRDFIQLHQVDKYLNDIEKYAVALGHNRAATTGRGSIVDYNAHPFQYGKITLVHNGHIRNTHDLRGASAGAQCLVDSAQVAFSMDANGERETLEQIDGGFVFVWWNSDTGILNIARNNERPLHWAFAHKENTFYWASELTELLHLLKDVQIDEDIGILYPSPYNWYKFDLKDLRSWEKIPFVKSQGRQNRTTQRTGHTGEAAIVSIYDNNEDDDLRAWELRYGGQMNPQAVTSDEIDTFSNEIDEIRQRVANQRLKDAKQSGIPTSKKRIIRATMELRKLGIDFNSLRICIPLSWCKYKNQKELGSILARTRKEGHLIEILQVKNEQYLEYKEVGRILVDCVNVRNGPHNDRRIIGIVSPKMEAWLERRKKDATVQLPEGTSSIERNCEGPDGVKITTAKFLELTDKGCAHCQCDISTIQHAEIVWVGRPPNPLCAECGTDPAVIDLLGLSGEFNHGNIH